MKTVFQLLSENFKLNKLTSHLLFVFSLTGLTLVVTYFSLVSCNPEIGGVTPAPKSGENENTYKLLSSNDIVSEYPNYLVVVGLQPEQRDIYFCGKRTLPLLGNDGVWWSYGSADRGPGIYLADGGKNGYYEVFDQGAYAKYTVKVALYPTLAGLVPENSYTFTSNLGDGTTSAAVNYFVVNAIAERTYNIKYSCQVGYDVFDDAISWECSARLNKAYTDAATTVALSSEITNLAASTVNFLDPLVPGNGEGLWKYVYNNISNQIEQTKFRLISVFDVTSELPSNVVGYTFKYKTSTVFSYGFSFVIYDRTKIFSGDIRRKEVTRIVIHELGHLRAQFDNITDVTHTSGHNGVNQTKCVMLDGDATNISSIRNNPVFCSGHLQFLLNKQ